MQLRRYEAMKRASRVRTAWPSTQGTPAVALLLIGLTVATCALWFLGAGHAATAVAAWFLAWLMIWTSLPTIGHAYGL